MPCYSPPNQGGDVPTPQKNKFKSELDRVGGSIQPNPSSPPPKFVDGYICQYSDQNSISSIADFKKGNWSNLAYISIGKNMLTKAKIKLMIYPLSPSYLPIKIFSLNTSPLPMSNAATSAS